MTQYATKIQREIANIERLRRTVKRVESTGLCAVCSTQPAYEIRPGVHSMTCARLQCGRAWLLNEPWRCEFCQSLDFHRLDMRWDDAGRKMYHCNGCKRTYAVHHRAAVETMPEVESEDESNL